MIYSVTKNITQTDVFKPLAMSGTKENRLSGMHVRIEAGWEVDELICFVKCSVSILKFVFFPYQANGKKTDERFPGGKILKTFYTQLFSITSKT